MAKPRLRATGHKLTLRWSGEYGAESSSTGECTCGWSESASSQREVRWWEYTVHLCDVLGLDLNRWVNELIKVPKEN